MTVAEMLIIVGHRLEDPSGDQFNDTLKYLMLNRAQDKMIQYLNQNALSDLHSAQINISNTEDTDMDERYFTVDSSTFTTDGVPFGGVHGIQAIKRNNSTTWYTKISFEQFQDWNNGTVSIGFGKPVYWVRGNKVYLSENDSVDVYYLKKPNEMGVSTECSLNAVFHDALVELAEAECWRTVREFDRQNDAEQRAFAMIGSHNENTPAMDFVSGSNVPYDTSGDLVFTERVVSG